MQGAQAVPLTKRPFCQLSLAPLGRKASQSSLEEENERSAGKTSNREARHIRPGPARMVACFLRGEQPRDVFLHAAGDGLGAADIPSLYLRGRADRDFHDHRDHQFRGAVFRRGEQSPPRLMVRQVTGQDGAAQVLHGGELRPVRAVLRPRVSSRSSTSRPTPARHRAG